MSSELVFEFYFAETPFHLLTTTIKRPFQPAQKQNLRTCARAKRQFHEQWLLHFFNSMAGMCCAGCDWGYQSFYSIGLHSSITTKQPSNRPKTSIWEHAPGSSGNFLKNGLFRFFIVLLESAVRAYEDPQIPASRFAETRFPSTTAKRLSRLRKFTFQERSKNVHLCKVTISWRMASSELRLRW